MTLEEAKKIIEELDSDGMFNSSDYEGGFSDAKEKMLKILDEVDTEPVGISDKMTLRELARELRKIFKFKYLTYDRRGDDWYVINLWISKPVYQSEMWWPKKHDEWLRQVSIDRQALRPEIELDLSEYPDINGLTDYSKCIVEVPDDIK